MREAQISQGSPWGGPGENSSVYPLRGPALFHGFGPLCPSRIAAQFVCNAICGSRKIGFCLTLGSTWAQANPLQCSDRLIRPVSFLFQFCNDFLNVQLKYLLLPVIHSIYRLSF